MRMAHYKHFRILFFKNAVIIPVAVPPVSDVVTCTYTVVSLAKAPFCTLKVKLAPPAPSLAEYVVELNPMVTPDIVIPVTPVKVIPVGFQR